MLCTNQVTYAHAPDLRTILVRCYNCPHEFCWICMGPWSEHNDRTGGYYTCNKWRGGGQNTAAGDATAARTRLLKTERFVHYFGHYTAQASSQKLEQAISSESMQHMAELQKATRQEVQVEFLRLSFDDMRLARSVLCASYVVLFFLADSHGQRRKLEKAQADLLQACEKLSDSIARKRLKETRDRIVNQALKLRTAREVCLKEFQGLEGRGGVDKDLEEKARSAVDLESTDPEFRSRAVAGANQWVCTGCTLLNDNSRASCELCGNNQKSYKTTISSLTFHCELPLRESVGGGGGACLFGLPFPSCCPLPTSP